jgi:hypothetical protein
VSFQLSASLLLLRHLDRQLCNFLQPQPTFSYSIFKFITNTSPEKFSLVLALNNWWYTLCSQFIQCIQVHITFSDVVTECYQFT